MSQSYNDEATLRDTAIVTTRKSVVVCVWSKAVTSGESVKLDQDPSPPLCQYEESAITSVSQSTGILCVLFCLKTICIQVAQFEQMVEQLIHHLSREGCLLQTTFKKSPSLPMHSRALPPTAIR